jgi:threonine dehydrogenase-like Zn-dependent dehydrogenase
MWSGTVAFIEPDPTRLEVVDAWLGVQFWFKNTGDRTAKKNMANGGDTTSLNIETSGIYLGTGKVFEFCRQLLPNISNIRAIPDVDMELPNDVIEPEVEAVQR